MRLAPDRSLELVASDLSQFLGCRHRTGLDLAVARGVREAPDWVDPATLVLQQRGLEHERRYADALRTAGLVVEDLSGLGGDDAVARTTSALARGVDVVLQGALRRDGWFGRPDVLRRVEAASALGPWSYQVFDTKLAREAHGGMILQLALYSELLGMAQGRLPDSFHIVTPDSAAPQKTFRLQDFAAYFRLIRTRLHAVSQLAPDAIAAANYPEPVEHCDVCRWWRVCDRRRRADDHLSLVAGLSGLQSRELQAAGIRTLAQLGTLPLPLPLAPRRGAIQSYVRVREQARLQLAGRQAGLPVHELLPIVPEVGLTRLPEPSPGDVFLDLEGDPFAREGGREYLFGLSVVARDGSLGSRAHWAVRDAEERVAFEAVVDEILRLWAANPGMHVYHYAPYEPAALKRLMGRHATREADVDRMLRAELFVDLYAVVKHALRASVERYSIKDLEPFYGFVRSVPLVDARTSLRVVERALEVGPVDLITPAVQSVVEGYNRDDCISAFHLRAWLERLRASLVSEGTPVPRPTPQPAAAPEHVDEHGRKVAGLVAALTQNVPTERAQRDEEEQARWLLAHILDWHRREDKAPWWEFFRLRGLSEEELFAERAALSGLRFVARVGGTKKSPIDRYAYPLQDAEVAKGEGLHVPDGTDFGTVEAIDRIARTVDVKKRAAQAEVHPSAVFAHSIVDAKPLAGSLLRIGQDVVERGLSATCYPLSRQLLLGAPPRLRQGEFAARPGESPVDFAIRVAPELDGTVLAIQGPPGAGKTFTGARMIRELLRRGARVGVTAASHKVIRKLLDDVAQVCSELGMSVPVLHKVTTRDPAPSRVEETTDNAVALARLAEGGGRLVGGTAWLWARPEAAHSLDVLFVDEAGQMSLANVLAVSPAATNIVLLGDTQQLEQPQQGSHPEGTDVSALEHVLQGHKTIPAERGIFLPETWRLSPAICAFTSEVFYEGRLRALPGLERQGVAGTQPFEGAGLWAVAVAHEGNQSSSPEEVDVVERVVAGLLRPGACWANREGQQRQMTANDILVVAPYNSHVSLLAERLVPYGVRVGTVDKFQGQEAPVVVYSMATSAPEDAPRGMEFLYSLNRLNVATSRARCACILVASPRLFAPDCKSPRQMQLANALCRYLELARQVTV